MSHSVERYVIKHLSGSKINQVEEFDFHKKELSIGRAASSDIQFDPEREVVVSREHGLIIQSGNDPLRFTITDNNSRNGIFVNKNRVKGTVDIQPGDEIQLGNNGPVFTFDIYPRPQDMMAATRLVEIPTSIKATSISTITEPPVVLTAEPVKTGLGKQTVERMLVAERKKSYGTMAFIIAGLILALGGLGFAFRDKLFKKSTTVINNIVADSANKNKMTPEAISSQNDDKVVQIEFGWQLKDTRTGEELWHEFVPVKAQNGATQYMALYIRNSQGVVEPYINVRRNTGEGIPVGMTGASGSGFVVSEDGYILTNRHVGAGWHTRWQFEQFAFPGLLVSVNSAGQLAIDYNSRVMPNEVFGWVPANSTMVGGQPVMPGVIQGENTYLNVVFSGTSERRMARLAQPSDEHDVALIKVDIPTPLQKVKMKDAEGTVQPGQAVTVMGYPGIAPAQVSVRSSKDPFNPGMKEATVPTPTVTPGNIGRIIPATSMKDMRYSGFGDSYQLTINATGSGNSGGPLFDGEGNVIGIYYAGATDGQGTRITFAIPIKYGLQLMGIRKS